MPNSPAGRMEAPAIRNELSRTTTYTNWMGRSFIWLLGDRSPAPARRLRGYQIAQGQVYAMSAFERIHRHFRNACRQPFLLKLHSCASLSPSQALPWLAAEIELNDLHRSRTKFNSGESNETFSKITCRRTLLYCHRGGADYGAYSQHRLRPQRQFPQVPHLHLG